MYDIHRAWKRRVYRAIWARIKQYWDGPKWIRVTDDEQNLKWVGINQPATVGEILQEKAQTDPRAAMLLQQLAAANDPRLNQTAKIRNNVAELDVDIILEEGPDTVTIQQEQFAVIADLAKIYGPEFVPFEMIVEASSLRNKERMLENLKGDPQAQQQDQQIKQAQFEMVMREKAATTAHKEAQATKTQMEAEQKYLENQLLLESPVPVTSVAI